MKRLLLIALILSVFARLYAVPAYPYPVVFTQPNGVEVTIIMKGDEFVNFAQTLDGYTLLHNEEGYFCYAQKNAQGDIEPSKFYAEEISNRKAATKTMLAQTPTELRFSSSQISMYQQIRDMVQHESENSRAFSGEIKLIAILMQFANVPMIKTQQDFHNLFNQIKYTQNGFNGSVKDFFLEVSHNQVDVTTTVVGPFTSQNNRSYYTSRGAELASEGVRQAYASGVNFSHFTAIDGRVSVYMIFAGHGREAGASAECIWSHASPSANLGNYNGVNIRGYACSPEHRGPNGTRMTNIGVICHELGHNPFGNPDYYDTNYNDHGDGEYQGTGRWDLQAGGSWNDEGRTPAPPNPRWKMQTFGIDFIVLNTPQTVTIPSSRLYENAYFRINTQTANEYFIIENKTRGGFDNSVPGTDLVIYRCDANVSGMNQTSPQKFYPVAANAPVALPSPGNNAQSHYGSINSGACPWPGTTGKTEFHDTTIPAMVSWANVPTEKPITNITRHGDFITFDFMGGGEKTNFHVFLPNYHGCVITPLAGSTSPVNAEGSFSFLVDIMSSHSNSEITVSANDVVLTPEDNVYTISNIQEDQIVKIEGLAFNTLQITASAGENGTITPSGTITVNYGWLQAFQITPDLGYSVNEILVDGENVGNTKTYSLGNITQPHNIYTTFKPGDLYTIDVTPSLINFHTNDNKPSKSVEIIVSSSNVIADIEIEASPKFQIFSNGNWMQSLNIKKNQLPNNLFIRYVPSEEDDGVVQGAITLKSTEAYTEVQLFGYANAGINDVEGSQNIVVYPNPTTGELRITSNELQVTAIEIFDVYGRNVGIKFPSNVWDGWQPKPDGVVLNISHLSNGMYFIKIYTENGEVTKKIIKN